VAFSVPIGRLSRTPRAVEQRAAVARLACVTIVAALVVAYFVGVR
jgi:hypothetical protein